MSSERQIKVNQLGYPIGASKVAVFTKQYQDFEVVDQKTEQVVYRGQLSEATDDQASGDVVYLGDFSELTATGHYQIKAGNDHSATFVIDESPYQVARQAILKAFYFYRCGIELTEEFAGEWAHKACHLEQGIVFDNQEYRLDGTGGWHDAGDYGKYTVAGAKAVADLLLAYELKPDAFKQEIPIPETDGIIPDILHECRFELDWLLKMQELDTGGVYHKLTTLEFPGLDVMPEDDLEPQYFTPMSATATGTFAAIMAMAARVYHPFDQKFATLCLERAEKAWQWLLANPEVPGFKNPIEITTGEYGDNDDRDERYWAAAELFRTTGEESYHQSVKALVRESFPKNTFGWADMGGYGTIAYLLNGEAASDQDVYTQLKASLIKEAEQLVNVCSTDGYLISLKNEDYIWGSNMELMNQAMTLLFAHRFTEKKEFEDRALDHVHYLFGRNTLDMSYVTGYGDRSVMEPHHRPSVGDDVDAPVPGLVSGGPNAGIQDEYAAEHLQGRAPAKSFADHEDSYATNEVTIYWNSPALFVLAHF